MDKTQATAITKKYIESQFPQTCPCCGVVFKSLADYLRNTTHLDDPVSYDADLTDYQPKHPIGTASYAVCKCGSTLVVSSEKMPRRTLWKLLLWASVECLKQGISMRELLRDMRDDIDRMTLSEYEDESD